MLGLGIFDINPRCYYSLLGNASGSMRIITIFRQLWVIIWLYFYFYFSLKIPPRWCTSTPDMIQFERDFPPAVIGLGLGQWLFMVALNNTCINEKLYLHIIYCRWIWTRCEYRKVCLRIFCCLIMILALKYGGRSLFLLSSEDIQSEECEAPECIISECEANQIL